MFKYDIRHYLSILKSFILPAEALSGTSIINPNNFTSTELYLPFVGSILCFAALPKRVKKWDGMLLLLCLLFMFVPILNSVFVLGQNVYYARWFYMPSLIMSLLSIKCIEKKYPIKPGVIVNLFIYIIFGILAYAFSMNNQFIFDLKYFIVLIIVAFLSLVILIFINHTKEDKKKYFLYMIFISLFIVGCGNYIVYKYKGNTFKQYADCKPYLSSEQYLSKYNDARSNSNFTCNGNYGFTAGINHINTFIILMLLNLNSY